MLTRDNFEAFFKTGKQLSAATLKGRVNYLWKQYRDIANGANDLSYLNTYSKVIKHIRESKSEESRKTRLFHTLSLINTKAGREAVKDDARQSIQAAAQKACEVSKVLSLNNVATSKQQINYKSIDEMIGKFHKGSKILFEEYDLPAVAAKISDADFAKWNIESDRKNILSYARDFQRLLMIECYVYQPALRSDWGSFEIISAPINRLDPNTNWIQILRAGRIRLLLNQFKNVKTFGKQVIEVESILLKRYLRYWVDLLQKLFGAPPARLFLYELSPVKEPRVSSTNRESFARALSRNAEKILHGLFTGQLYNWQRRGLVDL